jgi:hypothetical protein
MSTPTAKLDADLYRRGETMVANIRESLPIQQGMISWYRTTGCRCIPLSIKRMRDISAFLEPGCNR